MYGNNTETTANPSTQIRSVFFCSHLQSLTWAWDLDNTTLAWILVAIISIASPVTILLNSLVIIAVKKKKELQKHANIVLASLAVADLLAGAITMPSSAAVDILILRQVSFEHICRLELMVTKPMMVFLSASSLYHLTVIAWERYIAIQKWMDYKVIVTKRLLRKLALAAWLLVVFTKAPLVAMPRAGVELWVVKFWRIGESVVVVGCLVAIAYFYVMVYLGMRKRKVNEISNDSALMKAKLQSKVAKTTAMLTAALIISFIPSIVIPVFRKISSVFRTNSAIRFMEAMVHLNSLVTPILYCYRDRSFRKAVLELLGIRKSRGIQLAVDASRFLRRKNPFGSVELQNVHKPQARTKSASCDPAADLDCVHSLATPHRVLSRRSMSAPKINECSGSLHGPNLHQPSSNLITTATIHAERNASRTRRKTDLVLSNDAIMSRPESHTTGTIQRSKSWVCSASAKFTNSFQGKTVRRPKTAH